MKKRVLSYLSTGALVIGAVLGGYALVRIYILQVPLPPGACPVTTYRPLLYAGITFLLLSFILSLFESRTKKCGVHHHD